jgi:hypothetical protein
MEHADTGTEERMMQFLMAFGLSLEMLEKPIQYRDLPALQSKPPDSASIN